jgi:dTDP-4-amino-4,6-dideoxygalactose transaminase
MKVPFVDLAAGIAPLRDRYLDKLTAVLDSAYFAGGPEVDAFERAFAEFCGTRHAVAVATGTDALLLALRALGVGAGDEVITAPNSFFATAEAISHAGAIPVFADVRDDTLTIDPAAIADRITTRTKAIVPVHLYGQLADLEPIRSLAEQRGLKVLEDSAQAHGATRGDLRAGSAGDAAAFSFYPAKNLGAFGEGGAVTTDSDEVAGLVRALRDHGQAGKHDHQHVGYNARLPAMLCACLSIGLGELEGWNQARRRLAAAYRERLAGVDGVRVVAEDPGARSVYHLFVIRVAADRRDQVMAALGADGVATAIHYPTPIHLQPAYAGLGYGAGDFPVAEAAAREIISLPMYPQMTLEQVDHVTAALARALG